MPLRYFGIFLAYGPTVDLRKEGLGRLLGAFLKAASTKEGVRFVIACPEWLRSNFLAFCEGEQIPANAFDIVTTDSVPLIVRLYLWLLNRKRARPAKRRMERLHEWVQRVGVQHRRRAERSLVSARTIFPWLGISLYAAIIGIVLLPLAFVGWLAKVSYRVLRRIAKGVVPSLGGLFGGAFAMVHETGEEGLEVRLYRLLEETETQRLVKKIDTLRHVKAWLSPTAFWPEFNQIAAPTLLCVPDMLLTEFPVGFAREPEVFGNFQNVERAIRGAQSFVTYSTRIKWNTLVERDAVPPDDVTVVRHACWDLSPAITVKGFSQGDRATRAYCESLFQQALGRLGADDYVQGLHAGALKFLFYPSQFRPNKNVLLLIEAYEHLLRERFIQHKLILTGDPRRFPQVSDLVRERGLGRDVIFLHGLTAAELAACYHLADLAINPSLSEGGCPFTFTEALSVDTPVVMARIPVTEEVLSDPGLQEMMLFDPYDYKAASSRIEWALKNRETLLSAQREAYANLRQRGWGDVVDEYVVILDGLCQD